MMDDGAPERGDGAVTRRWLLGAAGATGVALLASCSSDDSAAESAPDTSAAAAATAATTAAATVAPSTDAPDTTAAADTTAATTVPDGPTTASLVQRFIDEAWNEGRLEVVDEIFTFPYSISSLNAGTPPFPLMDAAALKQHVTDYLVGFPDMTMTTELVVEQGPNAFVQTRLKGTHTGPLMGIPPTGRPIDFVLSATYFGEGGTLSGHSVLVDLTGLFSQIGLIPDLLTIVLGALDPQG